MSLLHKSENCFLLTWKYWYKYLLKVMLEMVLKVWEYQFHFIGIYRGNWPWRIPCGKIEQFLLLNFLCNLNISYPVPREWVSDWLTGRLTLMDQNVNVICFLINIIAYVLWIIIQLYNREFLLNPNHCMLYTNSEFQLISWKWRIVFQNSYAHHNCNGCVFCYKCNCMGSFLV